MSRSIPVNQIRYLGDLAVLVGVEDARVARELVRSLTELALPGVLEVVGGLSSVLIEFDRGMTWEEQGAQWGGLAEHLALTLPSGKRELQAWRAERKGVLAGKLITVPCVFDGPDLDEVAELSACTPAQVVELMTAGPLEAVVVGFSPGFAYLSGLPPELRSVPRRASPRPAVPPGAVALANGHAAVYPTASPGGWHLIGRTDENFFSTVEPPYSRLAPGDRVQFTVARRSSDERPVAPVREKWLPPATSRPVFTVTRPGLRSLLQDGGRRGVAGSGVPWAGPADPFSLALANRLVGNADAAGALEVTAGGPTLRCDDSVLVAVVGGVPDLRLQGQPVPTDQVFPVNAGQELTVGMVRDGFRTYVAVAGGFVGELVLGSLATDQLCGLGPGPIARGDQLWADALRPPLGDHLRSDALLRVDGDAPISLRVLRGPHSEWFAPGAFEALADTVFRVGEQSNRVGVRLMPQSHVPKLTAPGTVRGDIDSQGNVVGVMQVPPDGIPVILLPDHATLGGYPVLAVVASADLGLLGQCGPGAKVVLVPINLNEARQAREERQRSMESAVVGHYPLSVG